MKPFVYWPYDEVSVTADPELPGVVVRSPWLQLKVRETEATQDAFRALTEKSSQQELSQNDLPLVNAFFQNLAEYPLCYIVPTPKAGEALDSVRVLDDSLEGASVTDVIRAALPAHDDSIDLQQVVDNLARAEWAWDFGAASAFADTDQGVHPESFFSVGRRYHLLEVLENDHGTEAFAFVEQLPPDQFCLAARLIVRQNHYVTEQCQSALEPAIRIAGQARAKVQEFMEEERGHDRILGIALGSMGENPDQIPVSSQTQTLIHLLRFAAERNFLAFALIVNFFERSAYQDEDPLARLLRKGGLEKAAKQINAHMEINDNGGHENIACEFLAQLAPCPADYAEEALRIAEAASLVMNSVTTSAVAMYKANHLH